MVEKGSERPSKAAKKKINYNFTRYYTFFFESGKIKNKRKNKGRVGKKDIEKGKNAGTAFIVAATRENLSPSDLFYRNAELQPAHTRVPLKRLSPSSQPSFPSLLLKEGWNVFFPRPWLRPSKFVLGINGIAPTYL